MDHLECFNFEERYQVIYSVQIVTAPVLIVLSEVKIGNFF